MDAQKTIKTYIDTQILSCLDRPGYAARTHKPLRFGPGNPGTCLKPLPNELWNPMPGDKRNHLFLVSGGCLKPLVSELRCSVMEISTRGTVNSFTPVMYWSLFTAAHGLLDFLCFCVFGYCGLFEFVAWRRRFVLFSGRTSFVYRVPLTHLCSPGIKPSVESSKPCLLQLCLY